MLLLSTQSEVLVAPKVTAWASLIVQLVKNLPAKKQGIWFDSWAWKIHWRQDRLSAPVYLGFPCGSAGKESAYNVGDLGWEDPVEKGAARNGSPLQYSGLENSMDCIVHGVAKSRTGPSNLHFRVTVVQTRLSGRRILRYDTKSKATGETHQPDFIKIKDTRASKSITAEAERRHR